MKNKLSFKHFKTDLLGGITAGIVALPLALAFGEQSGLGAAAGLYGAAFIAFFAAFFGGTATQISGPTAPMTALSMVVIAGLMQASEGKLEDALPLILMVFLLAGLFQILLGVLKLGSFIRFIPYTVVSGFMTGIGVIILITQILPALGYNAGNDAELINHFKPHAQELILDRILMEEAQDSILVLEDFKETIHRAQFVTPEDIAIEAKILAQNDAKGVIGALRHFPNALKKINFIELLLAMITIFVIYGFKKITTAIPSTLVALLLVSGVAYYAGMDYMLIQEIPSGFPALHFDIFSEFSFSTLMPYFMSAILLALLGAIDSLLTSVVADNMTKTQHDPNQELIGQGIGNGVAAMFGGIPGGGATIRTVVNIQAGGKTKLSGMLAGLLLFVILIALGPLASNIPAAVLAGILITVGIGVMDYKGLRDFPKMELPEKAIMITVLVLTVFWQLVYAVAVGLIMASLVFLKQMSDQASKGVFIKNLNDLDDKEGEFWEDELTNDESIKNKVFFKHLSGPMFFGVANDFRNVIADLPHLKVLVIRMEKVPFMDQSGLYALEAAIELLHKQDVVVALSGVNTEIKNKLIDVKVIPTLLSEELVFEKFKPCRAWLRTYLLTEKM
jgi:SulP family sulfate permease